MPKRLRIRFLNRAGVADVFEGTKNQAVSTLWAAGYLILQNYPSAKSRATKPGAKLFEHVHTMAGPEAQRLATDARKDNILTFEWDPGGRDLENPLRRRPDGLYITDGRGQTLFLSRTRLADLARQELKELEKKR
jgi:hypothetical protein